MEIENRIEEALEYMQNDTDYALELFNGILKEHPNNINALNGKGSTLMKLHKNEEALKFFDCSLSIEENASAYLNKGIIAKSNGDYKNALIYFDKALEFNPRLSSIVSILKNEIIDTINLESTDLDSLYSFTKEANSLIREGMNYKNQNKLWNALDCLEKAIEEDPRCKNSVNDLIKKVEKDLQKEFLNNESNSKNTSESEKNENSKDTNSTNKTSKNTNSTNKTSKNTKSASKKTENRKLNKLKTLTYRSIIIENNPHKALSLIDRIFKINANDLDGINYKGIAYFNLEDYEKSIECFDKCLSICDEYTFAYFNKGLVLRRMRMYEDSLKCFEKALKIRIALKK